MFNINACSGKIVAKCMSLQYPPPITCIRDCMLLHQSIATGETAPVRFAGPVIIETVCSHTEIMDKFLRKRIFWYIGNPLRRATRNHSPCILYTSKEPVCPRVELILKIIIIILLIIFLGFIKSKPC